MIEESPAESGGVWLVTQFVEGEPLIPGPVALERALSEALGVALALAAIHGLGTHHGDVSANNVIVTPTQGVVLTDLGQLGSHGCGTPGFLAPEVLAGGGGPAADRFGVGSLLCLRLFGQVPWRRPDALLAVDGVDAVRRRLRALAEAADVELPVPLASLLERLLDPRPERRVADPELLVSRLRQLHRASSVGESLRAHGAWWLPTRWSFIGPDERLAAVARELEAGRSRLVAVVGPRGSGRGRVVEELIAMLQLSRTRDRSRGVTAMLGDATSLAGEQGSWIEAWVAAGQDPDAGQPRVWGMNAAPPWPARLASSLELQAAVLRAGVGLGHDALLLPVDPELGRLLAAAADEEPALALVEVEPWGLAEVRRCLREVVEAESTSEEDIARWSRAIHDATGGWPARVVRAIEAYARTGGEDPDRAAIERALVESDSEPRLDPETARRVLDRRWGLPTELPPSLVVDGQPLASAVAAARVGLGDTVAALAEATIARVRAAGGTIPLALALDADDADAIEAGIHQAPEHGLPSDLVDWLERGGVLRVGPRLRLRVLRELIRRGEAERALRLLEAIAATGAPSPAERLEGVRALEQLGRAREAIEAVDALLAGALCPGEGSNPDHDRALGLRWRALVDVGESARARTEAERWAAATEHSDAAPSWRRAVAWLWGGLAQLYAGGEAGPWLDRALDECRGEHGPSTARMVASLRARVYQLEANLAQLGGEGQRARERYRAAAESFALANESLGRILAEGSLASLARDAGEFEEALTRGRLALRGFLARAQVQTLPAACMNLIQALAAVGAIGEGRRVLELTRGMITAGDQDQDRDQAATTSAASALASARLWRCELELELAAGSSEPPAARDRWRRELVARLDDCALALQQAGASSEAADAHLAAAACARVAGRDESARAQLDAARAVLHEQEPDLALGLGLALECLAQAHSGEALSEATRELALLPTPTQLWDRGERLLAWHYDRTLLGALHRHGSLGDAAASSVARRMLRNLEELMAKAPPLDRRSLRQSLLSEAGEAAPLRELVRELELAEQAPAPEAPVVLRPLAPESNESPVAAVAAPRRHERADDDLTRLQQLLRLFRRLARHDRLEQLLEQIVEAMMELTDAERGVVCVGQGRERIEVAREFAAAGEGVTFSRSVIERVLDSGEPVLSVDAASDDRFDGSRSISHLNLRSVLAVPLVFRGERLGAAYVDHRLRRGNFDATDLSHMEDFADLAALAVAQARALAAVRSQAEELERQRAELAQLLESREVALVSLREEVRADPERKIYRGMVGASKAMQRVFRLIDRLADSEVPVVIYGESGTGKELVARAIHEAGARADAPFVAENCGAIPETLLESVLFGHARGAFTGAQAARPGLFEAASGGTIFLDEIGETSPAMQTKLLRVLQEGEIRRIGETSPRKVDVRVIAASNRDLEAMVEAGQLRQDLFYRINVVKLELPPLRDRREDVPPLIEHFLARHRREGEEPLLVSASALRKLTRYPWPGNVRELENEVQRWLALCEDRVMPDDLSPAIEGSDIEVDDPDDLELRPRVDRLERELIARAMERTGNNQTQAAQLLGLSRYGLQKKLKRMEERES